jgi:hypothetical protein
MKLYVVVVFICLTHHAKSQEIVFGDTNIIKDIQNKCSIIYESKDQTNFIVTRKRIFKGATSGTNIYSFSYMGNINRIVASTTMDNGIYAAEFYYLQEGLILIYESFEFYEESAPANQPTNFKGIPFWESRFYFQDGLVAHKCTGREVIGADYTAAREMKPAKAILEFVKSRSSNKSMD